MLDGMLMRYEFQQSDSQTHESVFVTRPLFPLSVDMLQHWEAL